MLDIRPISDLTDHYSEIEELVRKQNKPIYLTKNGYGSMVVLSIEKYESLIKELDMEELLEEKFGNVNLEKILDDIDEEIIYDQINFLKHDDIFPKIRRKINNE